jgi:N-acetylneuraminic acid mutarotase
MARGGKTTLPLGYGVAISHERGLVCIGGSDARQHHASVWLLRWSKGRIEIEALPDMPQSCAN